MTSTLVNMTLTDIANTDNVIIERPAISIHISTGGVTDCSKNICVIRARGI